MDLLDNQVDYDGNLLHYKLYRKLLKHILFIYSKIRMDSSNPVYSDGR